MGVSENQTCADSGIQKMIEASGSSTQLTNLYHCGHLFWAFRVAVPRKAVEMFPVENGQSCSFAL